jgi:hypothetical protein
MPARRIWLNPQSRFWLVLLVVLCAAPAVHADIRVHRVFSKHMVLQGDMNVSIWGWADAGENVRVQYYGQSLSIVTDGKGRWSVKPAPMKADAYEPFDYPADTPVSELAGGQGWKTPWEATFTIGMQAYGLGRYDVDELRVGATYEEVAPSETKGTKQDAAN